MAAFGTEAAAAETVVDVGLLLLSPLLGSGLLLVALAMFAPELPVLAYVGTGAQVTLDTVDIGYVCSFTLDNDLTGSDGSVLHIAGSMTFHIAEGVTPC